MSSFDILPAYKRIVEVTTVNPYVRKQIENRNPIYVNPKFDDRVMLMNFLWSKGFKPKDERENTWGSIKESVFPIGVDFLSKEYYCIQTVTCAAEAVSSGSVVSDRDLYEYMGVPVDMRFKEYREQVRGCFEEYSYSGTEIDAYFSKTKTLELLIESFEGYTRYGVAGYEPPAVASCLDMMYEP